MKIYILGLLLSIAMPLHTMQSTKTAALTQPSDPMEVQNELRLNILKGESEEISNLLQANSAIKKELFNIEINGEPPIVYTTSRHNEFSDRNDFKFGKVSLKKRYYDIVKCLLEHGANSNERDGGGMTPLHHAGTTPMVMLLLENDADIDARDKYGTTPIFWAYLDGNYKLVKFFLKEGANAKIKDNRGNTVLSCIEKTINDNQNYINNNNPNAIYFERVTKNLSKLEALKTMMEKS